MAFERLEGPLGAARADVHTAMVSAAVINANRTRRRPYHVKDFMPTWDRQHRERQTPEQMLAVVTSINRRLGGADHRPGAAQ